MAVLNFPTSPTTGERYTANGRTWEWNGVSWGVIPASALVSGLGDVTLTSVTTGDLLQYDGTDWVNATTELNDNTDVNLTSPTSGDLLQYDGTDWVNATTELNDNTDVSLTSVTSGESLHYNGTNWVNKLADFQVSTTATSLTASSWDYVIVTAATQTITLPASPANGDMVGISVGAFTDTVVGRNGNNISGDASDITIDVANAGVILIYSSSTTDWRLA